MTAKHAPPFDSRTQAKQLARLGSQKFHSLRSLHFGDPIAWLSELTKQRQYISLAIENLGALIVS